MAVSRFRAMQKETVDVFVPTSAFASAYVQFLSGVLLPAIWPGARYVDRKYHPRPCDYPGHPPPRRLRLMPSHKWAFTSRLEEMGKEGLEEIVGADNLESWGHTAWDIFDLHCTESADSCVTAKLFLTMTEKIGWGYFDPPGMAPQIVPHVMAKDLIGDFLEHDGALFLADVPEKVLFHELYAAGLPIFAPSVDALAWKFLTTVPVSEELMGQELLSQSISWQPAEILRARSGFAVEPLNLTAESDGNLKSWYWHRLAEWDWAPHVVHFQGVTDFIIQVIQADLPKISNG